MLNKILTIVLPIALPFLVYMVYVTMARRGGGASGRVPRVSDAAWPWLGMAGVALMAAVLISYRLVFSNPAGPDVVVEPNRYIDGEIKPYRVIERDAAETPPHAVGDAEDAQGQENTEEGK
jgi:hypothetical protein